MLKYGEIHGHCNVAKRESFTCELEDWPDENGCTKYDGKLGVFKLIYISHIIVVIILLIILTLIYRLNTSLHNSVTWLN